MGKGQRFLWIAALTASCARVPGTAAPGPLPQGALTAPLNPITLFEASYMESPAAAPSRAVLDNQASAAANQQWQALSSEIKNLDSAHQGALDALLWNAIKDKTQQELLLQGRQWQQHPDDQVQFMRGLLDQVEAMSAQEAQNLAKSVPAALNQSQGASSGSISSSNIPQSLKPAYDALSKRVKALSGDRAKAMIGMIWQDTKDLTSQQVLDQRQDWQAHPQKQLDYLSGIVTAAEQAEPATIQKWVSGTPSEILKAAEQAAQGSGSNQAAAS